MKLRRKRCPLCGTRGCKRADLVREWNEAGLGMTCGTMKTLARARRQP